MKNLLFLIVLSYLFFSCKNSEEKTSEASSVIKTETSYKINKLSWILGEWTNNNDETQSFERWEKQNDSTYRASSVTLKETDTVFAERMKLYEEKGKLRLYVETVGPQPNPVVFTQVNTAQNPFTFENLNNDFPTRIVYTKPTENKLHAWVSGTIDGTPQKIEFYFTKK